MKDLRRIQQIAALAEHGHFRHAARAMGISQPALSLALQSMEQELGVRLFDRNRGKVLPTEFGQIVLRIGADLLAQADEIRREIKIRRELHSGRLHVMAGTYAADVSGTTAMGRLMQKHPGLTCRLQLSAWEQTVEPVLARRADLALAETAIALTDDRLVAEEVGLHACPFFCRCGHPILRRSRIDLRSLMAYPWVAPAIPPRIFKNFPSLDAPAGRLDPKQDRFIPTVQVDTLASAIPIVRESDGLSAAPLPLIQREIESGTFVSLPFRAPWLRLNYGFIYLRDRSLSPAARAFMAEVRAVEAELKKQLASENATRAVTVTAGPHRGRSRGGNGQKMLRTALRISIASPGRSAPERRVFSA